MKFLCLLISLILTISFTFADNFEKIQENLYEEFISFVKNELQGKLSKLYPSIPDTIYEKTAKEMLETGIVDVNSDIVYYFYINSANETVKETNNNETNDLKKYNYYLFLIFMKNYISYSYNLKFKLLLFLFI